MVNVQPLISDTKGIAFHKVSKTLNPMNELSQLQRIVLPFYDVT